MQRNVIVDDLETRIQNGENIPGADKFIAEYDAELSKYGLERGENGSILRSGHENTSNTKQSVKISGRDGR